MPTYTKTVAKPMRSGNWPKAIGSPSAMKAYTIRNSDKVQVLLNRWLDHVEGTPVEDWKGSVIDSLIKLEIKRQDIISKKVMSDNRDNVLLGLVEKAGKEVDRISNMSPTKLAEEAIEVECSPSE